MSQTLDVNVLLYASNVEAPEHERAMALIAHLADGPDLVVVLWPVVMGYLRIATHPAVFSKPLTHADAIANIAAFLSRPHVRTVGESDRFWNAYHHLALDVAPRGNGVPDAHIVGLMVDHGIDSIWSRDRDFRKYRGITVRDPFDEKYRDAFGPRPNPKKRR